MANAVLNRAKGFLATDREDRWWMQPTATFTVLGLFVLYATVVTFLQAEPVTWSPVGTDPDHPSYLSPFYSPEWLFSVGGLLHLPFPVFAILWIPLGFRFTCYFARRTYYRGITADPAACAVAEFASRKYSGESKFPLILQNLHRYFLYFAIMLVIFHWVDIVHAFRTVDADTGKTSFHIGLGSLVLLADALFLTLYVFSCHSVRHLIGGGLARFTGGGGRPTTRYKAWSFVSKLNESHGLYFWLSLFAVGFADVYVRFLACHFG